MNKVKGNCIIVDSANQFLLPTVTMLSSGVVISQDDGKGGAPIFLKGIALAMTTTDAILQLGIGDTLGASVVFQLDKYTTNLSWDGLWAQNLIVTTISAGTGYIYFA